MRFLVSSLALLAILVAPAARAQTPGDCAPGRAQADLDVSDVRATLFNNGNLFYGNSTGAAYTVPKAGGVAPIYAANLWMAGVVADETRSSGATYNDFELWPGPLDEGGELPDPDNCAQFDRIYVVSVLDVEQYEASGTATPDLAEWPLGLGAPAVDGAGQPIETNDRDRVLDLAAGERPALSGSQMAFWVMNDVGNDHVRSGSAPLGVEVAVTAFAIISDEAALNQATVYRYTITNRSPNAIGGFRAGLFTDFDLGDFLDDYTGTDTTRGLRYVYNASDIDSGYGTPPAAGVDLLGGLSTARLVWKGGTPATNESLASPEAYLCALEGKWNDCMDMRAFGQGYKTDGVPTVVGFPGDPVDGAFWSEENLDGEGTGNTSGDRYSLAAGPAATLVEGESYRFDFALVFGQGTDRLDSITALRAASDRLQAAYDDGSLFQTVAVDAETAASPGPLALSVAPNPSRGIAEVAFELAAPDEVRLRILDVLGRTVAVLSAGALAAGPHRFTLESEALPAGLYVAVLEAGGERSTQTFTVAR